MSGFENDVMLAKNLNFDDEGPKPHLGIIDAVGKFPIGTGLTSPSIEILGGKITSPLGTLSVGYSSPNITLDVTGGAPYISISPYIVGSDIHSGFSTIQAAINAAAGAGASAANPLNVYIKPGTYAENITMSDGVCLVGFTTATETRNFPFYNQCTVLLTGTVTHASGTCSITGIAFTKTDGGTYNMATGFIYMQGCSSAHSSGAFWNFTGASNKQIKINECTFQATGTATFITNAGAGTITFLSSNSTVIYATRSTVAANGGGGLSMEHFKDYFVGGYTMDGPFGLTYFHCEGGSIGNGTICTSTANTTSGTLTIANCGFSVGTASTLFDLSLGTANQISWEITNCSINATTAGTWTYVEQANILRKTNLYTSTRTTSQIVMGTITSGFRGSQYITEQAGVATADATITTIATITVPSGGTTTVKGTISGQKSDSTDGTCGDFLICARNPAGTAILVGAAVANVMATTTGTFTATVTGATIIIRVTGIAATSYVWTTTYSYHSVTTST